MTVLGCIADDFTGATDLAGLLARSGAPVRLRIGVPQTPPADTAAFEIVALKTRTAPVAQAVAESRAALAWLRQAGASRFYWKYCSTFDSTPRGNIGPVAEALLADLGATQTIYCPAFPENGRTVFMGNLFVWRQLLAESPMKDHPLTPMTDSNLLRLLAPQVAGPVDLVERTSVAKGAGAVRAALDALKARGVAHVIVDAITQADLDSVAAAAWEMPLLTGGSALALPLPALYREAGLLDAADTTQGSEPVEAATLLLSGSCSAMTRAQVAAYRETGAPAFRLDPLELARSGPQAALDWLAAQDLARAPLLYATAEPEAVRAAQQQLGTEQAGAIVEAALAAAATLGRDRGARRFIVAGGETSGAVTQALGVTQLDLGAEIAPGVPWTFARSGGHRVALALKSGNFGTESFFTDARERLEQP